MPKLLVFAVCEKVLIDENKNISLIVLLQNVSASSPDKSEIPRNAITPKEWTVFAMWQPAAEDYGREFNQIIQILWPDGSEFKKHALTFHFERDKIHHTRMTVIGFPVGQAGKLTLNMWLEADSRPVGESHSYVIQVTHDL